MSDRPTILRYVIGIVTMVSLHEDSCCYDNKNDMRRLCDGYAYLPRHIVRIGHKTLTVDQTIPPRYINMHPWLTGI